MEQIEEGKLNWKTGLLLVFLHRFWIFFRYSTYLQKQQRKRSNVLFIYLSESSESSDYSCDFCQDKPRIWTTDINVSNAMQLYGSSPLLLYIPFFLVYFYMVLAHLRLPFWVFSQIKLFDVPKIILIKNLAT